MSSPIPEAVLAVLLLEAIIDLSCSIFTIICLSVTGTKRKKIPMVNRILMAVSVSNMCLTFIMSTNLLIPNVWPHLNNVTYYIYMIYYMTMYCVTSMSWLTCTLSIFYFLKIIPSQPGILTKLKNRTSTITGGFLLTAEVLSLGGGFLSILISQENSIENNSTESRAEKMKDPIREKVTFNELALSLNCLPIFLTIVTTTVSASLLKYYNDQMRKNIENINNNVKDYQSAVLTMTGLLMLYTLTFLTVFLFSLNIIDPTWGSWIGMILLFSFPTVQLALLIYGNPKLKEAPRKVLIFIARTIGSGQ
ncbi:taste receptor type 2 member 9-like [Hyla sarda]|uniref:taste receptor type 2 member 9-like n=1 Tax=Hyla sarda TaxID=327740 RepID=UPI0024C2C876|nr:taste receptor type 2 member 9-like [Hyla sarda]